MNTQINLNVGTSIGPVPGSLDEFFSGKVSKPLTTHYHTEVCQQVNITQSQAPETPLWEVDNRFLSPIQEIGTKTSWCEIDGRKAIPKQGIISFSGKQKQGKSLATYALTIPLLTGVQFENVIPAEKAKSIIVFDMEMGKNTLQQRMRIHHANLGCERNRFAVVPLLEYDIQQRQKIIWDTVNKYHPDIVIIDQIAKTVQNINDPVEATGVIRLLELIGTRCSCWCVIHENKGNNSDPRGHLGTELMNASVEAYTVLKKEDGFHIKGVWSRESDMEDSRDVCFTYDSMFGIQAIQP